MPAWVITRAPASPADCTDSTSGSSPSAADSAAGSWAVAMMSRSLTESAWRRSEPATSTRSAAGCERSAPTICSAMFCARESRMRGAGAALGRLRQRLEQLLLDLRAEPAQLADLLLLGGRAQRVERVDAELVVEPPRALRPEARQVHDRDQPGRELVAQLLRGRDVAGLVERVDLLLERLADAVDLGHAALARHRGHRHRGLAHGLGRRAVGDHAVVDRAVELVEVAELVEGGGDLGVGQVGHGRRLAYGQPVPGPVWLILPTYDEAASLGGVIARRPRRARRRGSAHPRGRRRLARRHRRARRAARRRGAAPPGASSASARAYVAGFARALAGGAELVCQMDADGSHDPAALPGLIALARGGADLVLGSRYVPGGGGGRLAPRAARGQPRRLRVRARGPARPGARPDRRAEDLARRRAARDRARDRALAGLRLPGRADLSRAAARPAGDRGADRVPRARRRALQDDPADRARGGLARARAALILADGRCRQKEA